MFKTGRAGRKIVEIGLREKLSNPIRDVRESQIVSPDAFFAYVFRATKAQPFRSS